MEPLPTRSPQPPAGTLVQNQPQPIPADWDMILLLGGLNPTLTVEDRTGATISGVTFAQTLSGLPYWNGASLQTANGSMYSGYARFDGRAIQRITMTSATVGVKYLFTPHNAAPLSD